MDSDTPSTEPMGTSSPLSAYIDQTRSWLQHPPSDPRQIIAKQRQLRAIAEQGKKLDREIRDDISELERRADRALYQSIVAGQRAGTVQGYGQHHVIETDTPKIVVKSLFNGGRTLTEIYTIGKLPQEKFEALLVEMRAEGNISRRNIIRKITSAPPKTMTRQARSDIIRRLAGQGYASRQMVKEIGVTETTIREIARDFKIEIPADRVLQGTHRRPADSVEGVERSITAIEGLVAALSYLDIKTPDHEVSTDWTNRIERLTTALNHFKKKIKDNNHE